jgi:hypothetical protein
MAQIACKIKFSHLYPKNSGTHSERPIFRGISPKSAQKYIFFSLFRVSLHTLSNCNFGLTTLNLEQVEVF